MYRILLILSLLYFHLESSSAQNTFLKFKNFTTKDGLSSNYINCIFEDSRGLKWIGTSAGLVKFDGTRFSIYQNNIGDSLSLTNNMVNCIIEDDDNRLWIGTGKGLSIYNRYTDTFTQHFYEEANAASLSSNVIRDLVISSDSTIWVATDNGFNKYIAHSKGFKRYIFSNIEEFAYNNDLRSMGARHNILWLGTVHNGLYKFHFDTEQFESCNEFFPTEINRSTINQILPDSLGIWIAVKDEGLFHYNTNNKEFERINIQQNGPENYSINFIEKTENENLWIGTVNGGLKILNIESRNVQTFKSNLIDPNSLLHNSVSFIVKDRYGLTWLGTQGGGISVTNTHTSNYKHFKFDNTDSCLTHNIVSCFYEVNNSSVLVGTDGGGLHKFNRKTNKFIKFEKSSKLNNLAVLSIERDKQGNYWVATWGDGILCFSPQGVLLNRIDVDTYPNLVVNDIKDIKFDNQNQLWIGAHGSGLKIFDLTTKQLFSKENPGKFNTDLFHTPEWINQILIDKENNIWVASYGGVIIYDGKNVEILSETSRPGIRSDLVNCLYDDGENNIWIGTSKGLSIYNTTTHLVKNYNYQQKNRLEIINSIVSDNTNQVWLTSNIGLLKFTNDSLLNSNMYSNQLLGGDFFSRSCIKLEDGTLLLGSYHGMHLINPIFNNSNSTSSNVIFTGLSINHKNITVHDEHEVIRNHIHEAKIIRVRNPRSITLDFSVINQLYNDNSLPEYKLIGFDKEWNRTRKHSISYTNLPRGLYTLVVRPDESSNTGEASIDIKILPPWYFSILALIVYISLVILGFLFIKKRIIYKETLRLEANKQKELDELKLQFFTSMSHEIRTPLTLISAPLEKLRNEKDINQELKDELFAIIARNTKRLMRIVNQILMFRKEDKSVLQLQAQPGNIVTYCREVYEAFKEVAKQRNIDYKFLSTIDELTISFDPNKVDMILFNLLSNAFKYTHDGGWVSITVSEQAKFANKVDTKFVCIKIEDNGIGIASEHHENIFKRFYQQENQQNSEKLGTGIGLALCKSLVGLHNGFIDVKSTPKKGSIFSVYLPLVNQLKPNNEDANQLFKIKSTIESEMVDAEILSHTSTEELLAENQQNLPKLLIIDDNTDIRRVISAEFSNEYFIIEAENGLIGFEQLEKHQPDIIISDVMMPVLDGIELTDKIKSDIRFSHIPIILLTAKSHENDILDGLQAKADMYITKPFKSNFLKASVKTLLENRKLTHRLFLEKGKFLPENICENNLDKDFIEKLNQLINTNLENPSLNADVITKEIGVSRAILYKKVKALTGQSVNEYIRNLRLNQSLDLLKSKQYSINEIATMVGFNSSSYFTKSFTQRFDKTPSEYFK